MTPTQGGLREVESDSPEVWSADGLVIPPYVGTASHIRCGGLAGARRVVSQGSRRQRPEAGPEAEKRPHVLSVRSEGPTKMPIITNQRGVRRFMADDQAVAYLEDMRSREKLLPGESGMLAELEDWEHRRATLTAVASRADDPGFGESVAQQQAAAAPAERPAEPGTDPRAAQYRSAAVRRLERHHKTGVLLLAAADRADAVLRRADPNG